MVCDHVPVPCEPVRLRLSRFVPAIITMSGPVGHGITEPYSSRCLITAELQRSHLCLELSLSRGELRRGAAARFRGFPVSVSIIMRAAHHHRHRMRANKQRNSRRVRTESSRQPEGAALPAAVARPLRDLALPIPLRVALPS